MSAGVTESLTCGKPTYVVSGMKQCCSRVLRVEETHSSVSSGISALQEVLPPWVQLSWALSTLIPLCVLSTLWVTTVRSWLSQAIVPSLICLLFVSLTLIMPLVVGQSSKFLSLNDLTCMLFLARTKLIKKYLINSIIVAAAALRIYTLLTNTLNPHTNYNHTRL